MTVRAISRLALLLFMAALAACTSMSSNYTGAITVAKPTRIYVCHGFDCSFKTRYNVTAEDLNRFAAIMADGVSSPEAERKAIARADMFYEERAALAIGYRDEPKSSIGQSREKGQMDCIDESTNTHSLLMFLENNGWLKHHDVLSNVSRGLFVDGRYPHSTAVIRERATGVKWAVDSWFGATGQTPDIVLLNEWRKRGVFGRQ